MFISFKAVASTAISSLTLFRVVSGQNITIVSPQSGQVIRPGDTLTVQLAQQSTTSSVQNIAFSTGFSSRPTDTISLGRPLGGTQFLTTRGNITFQINVPKASEFIDGLSNVPYEFKVAHYYFLGATSTPTINIASVPVNVQLPTKTNQACGISRPHTYFYIFYILLFFIYSSNINKEYPINSIA